MLINEYTNFFVREIAFHEGLARIHDVGVHCDELVTVLADPFQLVHVLFHTLTGLPGHVFEHT